MLRALRERVQAGMFFEKEVCDGSNIVTGTKYISFGDHSQLTGSILSVILGEVAGNV